MDLKIIKISIMEGHILVHSTEFDKLENIAEFGYMITVQKVCTEKFFPFYISVKTFFS